MSRRSARYAVGDDPIDWSGFAQESAAEPGPVEGSTLLAVVSGVMVVAGIAAVIWGLDAFGGALEQLQQTATLGDISPLAVAVAGALTLIPAVFGFQVAGKPVGFVAPTVLGIVGVFIGIVMAGVSLVMANAQVWPWIVGIVLSFAYLVCVVRVHKGANLAAARHGARQARRPTKDELWDEKNIWK